MAGQVFETNTEALRHAVLSAFSDSVDGGDVEVLDGATLIGSVALATPAFDAPVASEMELNYGVGTFLQFTAVADTVDNATDVTIEFVDSLDVTQFTLSGGLTGTNVIFTAPAHTVNTNKPVVITGQPVNFTCTLTYPIPA